MNVFDMGCYQTAWRALQAGRSILTDVVGSCSKKELAMMKKGAFVINYARGDVIHEEVLA